MKTWKLLLAALWIGIAYGSIEAEHEKHLANLKAQGNLVQMEKLADVYAGFTFNASQRELLERCSAVYRRLPEPERMRVEAMAHVFMAEVEFAAVGYKEVTEEMRLLVALEACTLILNRGFEGYRRIKRVEFWEHAPKGSPAGLSAERWGGDCNGEQVRLLWPATSAASAARGYRCNTILHEFAHVLDMADDRVAQSIPVPQGTTEASRWKALLDSEYPRLQEAHRLAACQHAHTKTQRCKYPAIGSYAVSHPNRGEFFPVASEVFITHPNELRAYSPEIYDQLRRYYGFDPATWQASRGKNSGIQAPSFRSTYVSKNNEMPDPFGQLPDEGRGTNPIRWRVQTR